MVREDKLREQNKTIKQLKSQVRQLRKQLRIVESELELIRELWEKDMIDMARKQRREAIEAKRRPVCPQCGNPSMSITMLGIWRLSRCEACDYFNREQIDIDED